FANLGADHSRDFLLLAIPDEITTILTYSPELAVRPFSTSRRVTADTDPQEAAKKLNAAAIVSGHLMDAGGRLNVTLEAIDAAKDKLLWRDVFEVASADLITMRGELNGRIRNGLLPRLSGGTAVEEHTAPRKPEAYALYLQAAAISPDPQPNKEGLRLLEEAVRLDPNYAAAWAALSLRAYYDYEYSDGGDRAMARSEEAAARALQLDPDLVAASNQQIVLRTETGHAIEALRDALALVARRPASADAHFVLSYALRYGGAIDESAAECDKAWTIDRGNRGLRSCAQTFMMKGDFKRARDFTAVDPGTFFTKRVVAGILFHEGKYDEVINLMPSNPLRETVAAWHAGRTADMDRNIAAVVENQKRRGDPEPPFVLAGYFAKIGRPTIALDFLRKSVEGNFCWAPMIDRDRLYDSLREMPEYKALYQQALQCHEKFMAELRRE
ncbi:MAG: hypothetical protein ACXWHG_15060, partial [Thermoanaerobaculia bacterium]